MKSLTIFVDLDGTIEDLFSPWIIKLNEISGRNYKMSDIKDWSIPPYFPELSYDEIMAPVRGPEIWKEVKPIPYAAEVLKRLKDAGHQIFIVTASEYQSLKEKMEDMFFKYFPFFTFNDVVITTNKKLLKGDVLIDDALHNLIGGEYAKIIFDASYNRCVDDKAEGLIRVYNWLEIEEIINKMANE